MIREASSHRFVLYRHDGLPADGLPEGPLMPEKLSKIIRPPAGEAYFSVEAAKGQLGYYIVSDGSTAPYRCRVRPPISSPRSSRSSRPTSARPTSRPPGSRRCWTAGSIARASDERLVSLTRDGVDPAFGPPPDNASNSLSPAPYALAVGAIQERKNQLAALLGVRGGSYRVTLSGLPGVTHRIFSATQYFAYGGRLQRLAMARTLISTNSRGRSKAGRTSGGTTPLILKSTIEDRNSPR